MANTYTQLYIHIIFAVKGRANLISTKWKDELYKYITGIITNKKQKLISINGMPDHIHMLVGVKPDVIISNLVRDVKANSSRFISSKQWVSGNFQWQNGFGAFTLGHSQLNSIINYIKTQEEHHKIKSFEEEYIDFLKKYEINFESAYVFKEL